jgi:hypothetical protein
VKLRELANEQTSGGLRLPAAVRPFVPSGVNPIHRLYREEGLSVLKRKARRRAVGTRAPILVEAKPNVRWSLDFVQDQFACGRRFRVFNIVDHVTRECAAVVHFKKDVANRKMKWQEKNWVYAEVTAQNKSAFSRNWIPLC